MAVPQPAETEDPEREQVIAGAVETKAVEELELECEPIGDKVNLRGRTTDDLARIRFLLPPDEAETLAEDLKQAAEAARE